ncbi:MAG: S8 family serine peptidase [Verrucomicrobia bacterium]|nr:S8 family serine peptidase [Verrucomicrobiota bacterium]
MNRALRTSLCLALLVMAFAAARSSAADKLIWRGGERVDADIDGWSLPQLLEHLAEGTGWQVFVEPGARLKEPVSVKFSNLASGEALGRLLGDLSFAVLPQAGAPAKLFVFRTSVGDATQRVQRREPVKPKPIADELVLLRKAGSKGSAEELAKRLGAKITGRVDEFGAYRLKFANEDSARHALAELNDNSDFDVDYNYSVPRPAVTEPIAASSAQALNLKPDASAPAGQLRVGLIDAAVQRNSPYGEFLLAGVSVAGDATPGTASPTHGTSMFETLLRGLASTQDKDAASSVRVLPVDVYGNAENTSTFNVAVGIVEALNAGATVINLSLASAGDSQLLHNVIIKGAERGVLFIAAAGNEPTTLPNYPAAYPEVLAVTAGGKTGLASYANRGDFVDVAAPGSSIIYFGGKAYMVSGTSASTAFVSGLAAGMKSSTGASAAAVTSKLKEVLVVPKTNGN